MKNYHKNPRQITEKQFRDLWKSLEDFGDLSGIVHDLNSDEIIGGNMRGRVFNINDCEIEITHRNDEPDEQGTVAHGFVIWRGRRYAYRQVRWTPRQCEQANIQANKLGGGWDFDVLANEFDEADLLEWGFEDWELGGVGLDDGEEIDDPEPQIGRGGRLYAGHEVEPYKLAHRIEAAWIADSGLAIELFAGEGQLTEWYKRRFDKVVTNDKNDALETDFSMTARKWLSKHLDEHISFSFIDFDDEGSPARDIRFFFEKISGKKKDTFILALTDGNGLNLKLRGKINLADMYLIDNESTRQATQRDYEMFEDYLTGFIKKIASATGFRVEQISSYRGREGNVVYQTWLVSCETD